MITFKRKKYDELLTAYAGHLKNLADPVREIVNILAKYWALPKGTEEYIRHAMEDENLFRPIVVVCVHNHYIGKGQNIVIDSCGESSRMVIRKIMSELEKSIRKYQTTLLEEEKLRQIQQKTIAATKKKLRSINNQLADLNRQLAKKQEQLLEIKHRIEILEKQRDALMTDEEEKFRIGDKVHWIDPAIEDFEPKDREDQLSLVWTVESFQSENKDYASGDDVVLLSCETGGECECYAHELRHI